MATCDSGRWSANVGTGLAQGESGLIAGAMRPMNPYKSFNKNMLQQSGLKSQISNLKSSDPGRRCASARSRSMIL